MSDKLLKAISNQIGSSKPDYYKQISQQSNNSDNSISANILDINNRQLMFRKQNNIRIKQSSEHNLPKHLKNLKSGQQQLQSQPNLNQQQQQQNFDLNNNNNNSNSNNHTPSAEYYDYVNRTADVNEQAPPVVTRKPLVKIKSTTVKNESVRVQCEEILNNTTSSNFDPTVNSAQTDSEQHLILVNLIHATMDAT